MKTNYILIGIIFILIIVSVSIGYTVPRYNVTIINSIDGSKSIPGKINDNSQVIGWIPTGNQINRSFFWNKGKVTEIGTLGGNASFVMALNNNGQVVGNSYINTNKESHAFLWENGKITDLGTISNPEIPGNIFVSSGASAINNKGQIAGTSKNGGPLLGGNLFLWENGTMNDLGRLGKDITQVHAITDSGQIIISCRDPLAYSRSRVLIVDWNLERFASAKKDSKQPRFSMKDMGCVITELTSIPQNAIINDANNNADIIGSFTPNDKDKSDKHISHAFIWRDGLFTDLGAMNGMWSRAAGVNDIGQVVGTVYTHSSSFAVIWEKGKAFDLNRQIPNGSGWNLLSASDINSKGQIIGTGILNGNKKIFLLTSDKTTNAK
ncbi:MAG: hypothetical protein ACYC0V_04905 [Armatimonadota bacterium]